MATSYIRYMKDVAQLLGATTYDANSFSEDMFYFERRIVEVTPSAEELEDIRKHEIHTISSLKIIAPSVGYSKLLILQAFIFYALSLRRYLFTSCWIK